MPMGVFVRLVRFCARGGTQCFATVFLCGGLALTMGPGAAAAGPVPREISHIRYFTAPEHTRIVLDMTGPGSFAVRRVKSPDRIAINVPGAQLAVNGPVPVDDGLVTGIRTNVGQGRAQVVVDLAQGADFRSFSLPRRSGQFDRIVLDVLRPAAREVAISEGPEQPFTIIVDPGHGGLDPGASRDGVREKTVVMDIAREVARRLNTLPGYRAVLTRSGDYGLELWQRVATAREHDGDLFLSIHCNTHAKPSIDGMEVYFLSLQGATDREAGELADQENAAELVGLDPGRKHDEQVMSILMDLKMTQVLKESARLSHHLLDAGRASGVVSGRKVKQAGFRVLKSLAMPSALVEVAYMSNPEDMAVLRTRSGRKELARVLVEGIVSWRADEPALRQLAIAGSPAWSGRYQVRRGDSLWGLARRHGTTVTEITEHNNLRNGAINVGQMLRLPKAVQEP